MRRVDLTETPAVRLARMLQEQDARLGRLETRPTGVKHLGDDGDVVWEGPNYVPDPENPGGPPIPTVEYTTWSVKDVPVITETLTIDLDNATEQIGQAQGQLGGMQEAINGVTITLGAVASAAADALLSADGRNSRIISLSEPFGDPLHPETGNELVHGDTWWQWDNGTNRRVIGAWVWDTYQGDWLTETLADSVLGSLDVNKLLVLGTARMTEAVVAKIIGDAAFFNLLNVEDLIVTDEALINNAVIIAIAARQIVTGALRTEIDPDTGLYATFDSFGLRVIDNDGVSGEGTPETLIKLGPDADKLLQLGAGQEMVSINSAGGVSGQNGSFAELWVNGRPINGDVSVNAPRGLVAWGQLFGGYSRWLGGRDQIIGLEADLEPGRVYRLWTNAPTVETNGAGVIPFLQLHRTLDGSYPGANWGASAVGESIIGAYPGFRTLPGMEVFIDQREANSTVLLRAGISLADFANTGLARVAGTVNRCIIAVEDVGTRFADRGTPYFDAGGGGQQPIRVSQTRRWHTTGWATYTYGGSRDPGVAKPTQGMGSTINRECMFFFDDMTAELAGATIHRITLNTWADHWWNDWGGTARWHWHGYHGTIPNSGQFQNFMIETLSWPRGAMRSIDIIPSEFGAWQSGARRGFGFASANTANDYYGQFSPIVGGASPTFIEVSYER